jgi:hypothetical protein
VVGVKRSDVPAKVAIKQVFRFHWRRRQMLDHLTMWLELNIDYGEAYLKKRALC